MYGLINMNPKYNNIVSVLSHQLGSTEQSDRTLCLCDLCSEPADRCVGLRCCPASLVCRVCAVRHLVTRARCWVCGARATSGDVTSLPGARQAIAVVSRGGDQGAEAEAWLRDFRRPLEKWRRE